MFTSVEFPKLFAFVDFNQAVYDFCINDGVEDEESFLHFMRSWVCEGSIIKTRKYLVEQVGCDDDLANSILLLVENLSDSKRRLVLSDRLEPFNFESATSLVLFYRIDTRCFVILRKMGMKTVGDLKQFLVRHGKIEFKERLEWFGYDVDNHPGMDVLFEIQDVTDYL